jgi:hypothetical protein
MAEIFNTKKNEKKTEIFKPLIKVLKAHFLSFNKNDLLVPIEK